MKPPLLIKWAAVFFTATLLWMVFEKLMGWHGARIAQHARYSLIYDTVFVTVFVLAFLDRKRSGDPCAFTLAKALKFGLALTVAVTLLSPLVQVITHRVISPEFFPNVIRLAADNNLLTESAARGKFNLGNYIVENLVGTFALGAICALILAFIVGRIKT